MTQADSLILNRILNSPWTICYNSSILNFFQLSSNNDIIIKYGLYSHNLDRFIIVDGLDLWSICETAQILSSKLATAVCIFSARPTANLKLENCLCWELTNKVPILPVTQTPTLTFISCNQDINHTTPPKITNDITQIINDQEFALFIHKSVTACKLADLVYGFKPNMKNINQKYYTDFFEPHLAHSSSHSSLINAGQSTDLSTKIKSILYKSMSIQDGLDQFSHLSSSPSYSEPNHCEYLKIFFDFLDWHPCNA